MFECLGNKLKGEWICVIICTDNAVKGVSL